jgi:argininosuccinate lyase
MALWGGRFEGGTDALVWPFNQSLGFDRRLWHEDITGSIAHAKMLAQQGIVSGEDGEALVAGLIGLRDDLGTGRATLPEDAEDIHSAVEQMLKERVGAVAGRLHTARSRNDQVATDVRLWLKGAVPELREELNRLRATLVSLADTNLGLVLPGRTHHQHAQPILLSHHLLAYFWMLTRDEDRLSDCARSGRRAAARGGVRSRDAVPDRPRVCARGTRASRPSARNSIDAVADRDFAVEFCAAASLLMLHLSRLAEEIVLWSSPEFGFVELSDAVTTGSSIMPQKKNPDVAELIRGKTGRVYGDLMTLLT